MPQIADCGLDCSRPMARFTKLVGAALVALTFASQASARQWWVMEGAAPTDTLHAAPTGRLPARCVVGDNSNASPAVLYEGMKGLGDATAHIEEEKGGEAHVYYIDQKHFRHVYTRFFRTGEACEAAVQATRNKAVEQARELEKYR
jgi:hypothetical protein